MLRRLLPGVLAAWGVLAAAPALGQEPRPEPPPRTEPPPPPPPAPPPEGCPAPHRVVTVPKVHIVETQTATTVPQYRLREVVTRQPTTAPVLDWRVEEQLVPDVELKPRVEERQVTCYVTKAVEEIDPCTGKCRTVYKQVPQVHTVKVTVLDAIPVQRAVRVKVPYLKPVPAELIVKRLVLDVSTVPAIRKEFYPLIIPRKVSVPSHPPTAHCPR